VSIGGLIFGLHGCSENSAADKPSGVGGRSTVGTVTGGSVAMATGGNLAVNTGGSLGPTGGQVSVASGGNATGGVQATGGVTTAGTRAAGGAVTGGAASGGTRVTGGAATGGSTAVGGAATGGGSSTGGVTTTGGTKTEGGAATGGTRATGGAATGGVRTTGGATSAGGASANPFSICTGAPASGKAVSIYVIGDSTASIYDSTLYPRTGWGQVLGDYFSTTCAVVKDKALSGRSSKSFYDEGAWTPVRDTLVAGDFVIIQFGHNDEKTDDPARYTEPQTTFKQYLTTYVNDTKTKKAFPILATPINRNNWSGPTLSDTHGGYPPAMRELAAALSVPLVDLTALTKSYFERIGPTETTNLFMDLAAGQFPNYPTGNTDNTHLQETGARIVSRLFTSDAYQRKLPIAAALKAVPSAP
jgi:lysophospholipase L1-like esterase